MLIFFESLCILHETNSKPMKGELEVDILSNLSQGLNQAFFPGHREVRVRGWEEAEKYPLPRDCEAVLLDADPNSDYIYMKKVEADGTERFERYLLVAKPVPKFDPDKYVSTSEFNKLKEDMNNGFDSIKQLLAANSDRIPAARSNGNNKQPNRSGNEVRGSEGDI